MHNPNIPYHSPHFSNSLSLSPENLPLATEAKINGIYAAMQENPMLGTATNILHAAGGLLGLGLVLLTTWIGVRMIMGKKPFGKEKIA